MIELALKAMIQLQNEAKKVLASPSSRFLRQRFEQPDARLLTDLSRSRKEARQNVTLMNNDGLLDCRDVESAVLHPVQLLRRSTSLRSPSTAFHLQLAAVHH